MTFGGGGMNTAISFANLELKTGVFTNLGMDWFSDAIIKELKDKNVDISQITKIKNIHSGFSFIINYGNYNEHVLFTHPGANAFLEISKQKLSSINTNWFYIASLGGKEKLFKKNIDTIFTVAKKKDIKISWNPGQLQLSLGYKFFKKYLKHTEVFSLNKNEAINLIASSRIKTDDISKLIRIIHSWGAKICVITNGHHGAYVYDGKKIYYEKAISKKPKNTTGAGDAFNSSFTAGLVIYNNEIKKSLHLGMIRSGNVVSKIGAQTGLLTKKELKIKI